MNVIPNADVRRLAESLLGIAIEDDGKDIEARQWWHCLLCDTRWAEPFPEGHQTDCVIHLAREVMENE